MGENGHTLKRIGKIFLLQFLSSVFKTPNMFAFNKSMQAIMAEGKQHALCVGVMKMSAESMWDIFLNILYC